MNLPIFPPTRAVVPVLAAVSLLAAGARSADAPDIRAKVAAPAALAPGAKGTVAVSGAVSYQACDDRQCFAPAKIPLAASVAVSKP